MSEADFQPLLEWLRLNPNWLLLSIFLVSLVESLALAGIIVPGVLLLFLVATIAGHLDFSVSAVLLVGFLGAVLGDGISFYLGHYFKDSIPKRWPFSRYPNTLKIGKDFFYKHGGKSIMFGRFIGPIRPIIPLTAGMFGMSQIRFTAFNSASALLWAPCYLLPGYITGKAAKLTLPADLLSVGMIFLIVLAVIAVIFRHLSIRLQIGSPLYDALLLKRSPGVISQKLYTHYQHFQQTHPRFEFPLASISLCLISSSILCLWTYLTVYTQTLIELDQRCLELILSIRSDLGFIGTSISQLASSLTLLGDEAFMYFSFSMFIFFMLLIKHYYAAIHIALSGIATALLTHSLKLFFSIERPDIIFEPPTSFAYPSGHSSGATVFLTLLASFIAQNMRHTKRWQAYLLLSVPIILISISRVVLGVHWLTDIVAGISLGLVISSMTRVSYSYFYIKDLHRSSTSQTLPYIYGLGITALWLAGMLSYQVIQFDETLKHMALTR